MAAAAARWFFVCGAQGGGSLWRRCLALLVLAAASLSAGGARQAPSVRPTDLVFVTDLFNSRQALFRHRGIEPAALLNASWTTCEQASSPGARFFRVYVHVKTLCWQLLGLAQAPAAAGRRKELARSAAAGPRAYHVYDVVDAPTDTSHMLEISRHVDAMVMSSSRDLRTNCRSRLCTRIPHHYNLNCSVHPDVPPRLDAWRRAEGEGGGEGKQEGRGGELVVGVVGSLPHYGAEFKPLTSEFARHRLVLRREAAYRHPCAFFDDIDLALAWSNPKHTSPRDLARKPAERFTNPVVLNIPTIGASSLASFHLPGARPFLRARESDVLPLLLRVARGQLQAEFSALRGHALADVLPARLVERYAALLAALPEHPPLHDAA